MYYLTYKKLSVIQLIKVFDFNFNKISPSIEISLNKLLKITHPQTSDK